jgi:hypothetical protein
MESPIPKRSKSSSRVEFFARDSNMNKTQAYASYDTQRKSGLAMTYLIKLGHVSVTRQELDLLDHPLSYAPPPALKPYTIDADHLSEDEETNEGMKKRRSTVRFVAGGRTPSMFEAIEERRGSRRKPRLVPRYIARPPVTEDPGEHRPHRRKMTVEELQESAKRLTTIRRPKAEFRRFPTPHDNIDMDESELARSADRLSVSHRPKTAETKFKTIHDKIKLDKETIERSAERLSGSNAKKNERERSRSAEVTRRAMVICP